MASSLTPLWLASAEQQDAWSHGNLVRARRYSEVAAAQSGSAAATEGDTLYSVALLSVSAQVLRYHCNELQSGSMCPPSSWAKPLRCSGSLRLHPALVLPQSLDLGSAAQGLGETAPGRRRI